MVSEFPPAGIIGLGLPVSTILLEIVLGERPDDFVDVLPGLKLKLPRKSSGWNSCHRSGDTSGAIHASRYSA